MFKNDDYRKIFGFFLKAKKVAKNPKFKKTNYGYKTFDSLALGNWKIFKNKNQIVKHKTIKEFRHGEYHELLEETIFNIVQFPNEIKIIPIAVKVIG